MENYRSTRKTEKFISEDGEEIEINSYCIGPFGEFCAVNVKRGNKFMGSRITPLIWIQRMKGNI